MLKIITDSAADVPRSEAEEYGIRVMPIPITVDGTTYREGVDFTSEEYYPMLLGASTIPTTWSKGGGSPKAPPQRRRWR